MIQMLYMSMPSTFLNKTFLKMKDMKNQISQLPLKNVVNNFKRNKALGNDNLLNEYFKNALIFRVDS